MKYHVSIEIELGSGDAYSAVHLVRGALDHLAVYESCRITSVQQGLELPMQIGTDNFQDKLLAMVERIMPKREGWQEGEGDDKA